MKAKKFAKGFAAMCDAHLYCAACPMQKIQKGSYSCPSNCIEALTGPRGRKIIRRWMKNNKRDSA